VGIDAGGCGGPASPQNATSFLIQLIEQENEQKFQPLPTDASTYDLESFQVLSRFTLRPP
jgi:hypothetical protein